MRDVMRTALGYVSIDKLAEAALARLTEVEPAQLDALKLRLGDWNRKQHQWRQAIEQTKRSESIESRIANLRGDETFRELASLSAESDG